MFIRCQKGQNAIEYLLLFAIVVIVLLLALSPNGFVTRSVNQALDLSVQGVESMANNIDFNAL